MDFSNLVSDNVSYNLNTATNLFPALAGPAGAYADNTMAFTVLTRNATSKLFFVYVNGAFQLSYVDTPGYANFTVGTAHFFVDDFATEGVAKSRFRTNT